MNNRTHLEKYLEAEPRARERKNKDRAIVNLLLKTYSLEHLTKEGLIELCHEFQTYDRAWRMILAEREELRGSDYENKTVLEQEKVVELGYEIGTRKLHIDETQRHYKEENSIPVEKGAGQGILNIHSEEGKNVDLQ